LDERLPIVLVKETCVKEPHPLLKNRRCGQWFKYEAKTRRYYWLFEANTFLYWIWHYI